MHDTNPDLPSFTFLVGIDVKGKDRRLAELALHGKLVPILESQDPASPVECWWVAEDDRQDGSDNDAAVFVIPGQQADARTLLVQAGLAQGSSEEPELDALEDWFVESVYNTDPEGKPVPEEDWSNRTLHGPFPGEEAARHFMEEVWPDGDTDLKEQVRGLLNPPDTLTGPLTLPGQLSRGERAGLVRRAALAFLHSQDPGDLDLGQLADALGVARADVEALG